MIIPPGYTTVQFTVPDDNDCKSIDIRWENIYRANKDSYSYVSDVYLARKYNLIYALVKTDKLKKLNKLGRFYYNEVPISSAKNIEFFKLTDLNELIVKEEDNILETINSAENQLWYKNGKLHRDNDLPAENWKNGSQKWYKNGKQHRDNDMPAVISKDGNQYWYKNGKFHRDNDLPAVIYSNGRKEWHQNGKLHRDNDLPAMIYPDGTQVWWKDGKQHRDNDLPAVIEANGTQEWWKNGKPS